jgi:DNA-binding GntR family transcriptional regulator
MSDYTNHLTGEDIYNMLKSDILSLKLKPGQRISENEIAEIYNVSRTPIKTAFLRLKGEKYIEIVPQKGSFITLLDMKYITDVIYMRTVLEMNMLTSILNSAAKNKVISLLEENMAEQQKLLDSDEISPTSFYSIDSMFHYTFFKEMGHETTWYIIQDCQVYYTRFRILDTLTTARYHELFQEHQSILQAIKEGNLEDLEFCVKKHLHGNLVRLAPKIEGEFKDYFK